ncbi:hypothetical protein LMG24238_00786 [Paraburkholderia sediminicola]|uniref:Uncharacterized protein n=2 Tax=Paraburkholderia sediminicola TaxID=458836 RepID=A0A6J4ZYF9_9BURK|nr:hypothetical protein LMG24238_00786 [Paraburkholderia sediminicola]
MFTMACRAEVGGYFGAVAIYPHSSLPIFAQWLSLGGFALANLWASNGLLRGDQRARPALILIFILGGALTLAFSDAAAFKVWLVSDTLSIAMLAALYTRKINHYLNATEAKASSFDRKDRQVVALHAVAVFGTYVILTSLFAHVLPTDSAVSHGYGPAPFLALFGGLIFIAYGIKADRASMLRETALLLIALASFLAYQCVITQVTVQILFPKLAISFDWNHTAPWVIAIAAAGIALLVAGRSPTIEAKN